MIETHDELPSTQTRAQQLAFTGCAHGTVVWAKRQTAGRGRAGRTWLSGEGSLTFSVVLTKGIVPARASDWSFVAGLALHDVFSPGVPVQLKWPNDVLTDRKKFAGILCSFEMADPPAVVCGIGVNLAFDPEIGDRACAYPGEKAATEVWLQRITKALDARAERHLRSRLDTLAAYRERLAFVGEKVEVRSQKGVLEGVVKGVSDSFELLLEDGTAISTADVWPA